MSGAKVYTKPGHKQIIRAVQFAQQFVADRAPIVSQVLIGLIAFESS
jgi:hypothetical protein